MTAYHRASACTGVVIGLVKDVDDPQGEGRIRVRFPWLTAADELSGWAPIAAPMAGKKRGVYYLPEIDDEALLAFEHGDIDHPFVLGFLHNGVDKPPDDGIDKQVRRIRSVSGHVLDLDDRAGKERVLMKTQGGHSIELKDADGTVEIVSKGGQKVTLADSPAGITVATASGSSVQVTDAPSEITVRTAGGVLLAVSDTGVTLTAPTAPVSVTCPTATVTATGSVTVTGSAIALNGPAVSVNSALTTFSGVVMCSSLVAGAVVSPTYSPGLGNLL